MYQNPDWAGTRESADSRTLRCPLCDNDAFEDQEGRMDSRWGFTSHKLVLKVCTRCRLVLTFSAGNSIFDFD